MAPGFVMVQALFQDFKVSNPRDLNIKITPKILDVTAEQ